MKVVWRNAHAEEIYEPRCSFCGKYKKVLKKHWFFTGLYCENCILEVLYDDARSFEEIFLAQCENRRTK
jgi:hypothetical protein